MAPPYRTAAAALALIAACTTEGRTGSDGPIEVVDDAGHRVSLTAPATRILSLIPGRTDVILALGAADRLIARTRYDADARLAELPSVDNALMPSVEWVLAQAPDLVIAWPDGQARSVVTRLRELGIAVYASEVETVADIERSIRHIGTLLGLEQRADSIVDDLLTTIDSVRASHATHEPVSTAYLIGLDPPMVAGPGTYIHEMIEAAGGRNVFEDASSKWPQIGIEQLLSRDPDVIIASRGGDLPRPVMEVIRERPGWRELRAVKTGRVYAVDADSVNRPGPTAAATARRFSDLLHQRSGGS